MYSQCVCNWDSVDPFLSEMSFHYSGTNLT